MTNNAFSKFGEPQDKDNQVLSWDTVQEIGEIQEAQEYVLLPNGIYRYTIVDLEKKIFEGSDKLPQCPQATVTFVIHGGELGDSKVYRNFFLTQKTSWTYKQLFLTLRLVKENSNGLIPWDKLIGQTGVAEVNQREYDGKTYNNIKYFLAPNDPKTKKMKV